MQNRIAGHELRNTDIITIKRLGTPVDVMVHDVEQVGSRVRFRWVDRSEGLTGSSDVAQSDTFPVL